jgi:hypothetical protein
MATLGADRMEMEEALNTGKRSAIIPKAVLNQ